MWTCAFRLEISRNVGNSKSSIFKTKVVFTWNHHLSSLRRRRYAYLNALLSKSTCRHGQCQTRSAFLYRERRNDGKNCHAVARGHRLVPRRTQIENGKTRIHQTHAAIRGARNRPSSSGPRWRKERCIARSLCSRASRPRPELMIPPMPHISPYTTRPLDQLRESSEKNRNVQGVPRVFRRTADNRRPRWPQRADALGPVESREDAFL
jgi:hypothetical protein